MSKAIPIIGFVAPSGTGKTTLLRRLVPVLRERGLRLGYLKHTHHEPEIDTPGKDSYELAEAGADQVMIASMTGWALIGHGPPAAADAALDHPAAYARHFDADALDLLLVEGFHRAGYPKIEVFRATIGKAPLYPQDPHIVAVVTDSRLPGDDHPPELPIEQPGAVADFIIDRLRAGRALETDPRDRLIDCYRRLRAGGYDEPRCGCVSARIGPRFWVVQADGSGEPEAEQILSYGVDEDLPAGASVAGAVHQRIYRAQPEAAAIVHAHPPFSIAVSFGGRDFQPVDYEGQRGFGSVPVVSVDSEESPEVAFDAVAEALGDFPSCLVLGRGSYAWGANMEQALSRIRLLELSAQIYVLARQAAAL